MSFELIRGDARHVSDLLAPASVDLIITSPPYYALRSYRDACPFCDGVAVLTWNDGIERPCPECSGTGRSHYDGQLGSEATPGEFIDNLIDCTRDWLKVLRPGGSIFVNLGDKRANDAKWGGASNGKQFASDEPATIGYRQRQRTGFPAKSLMGLPWRYANRCVDELGLILRADIIWHKPNGLPESVTDRVRQSHEYWFHLTREPRYFAAVDEVREAHTYPDDVRGESWRKFPDGLRSSHSHGDPNPLGKLPGSVWTIPSEPLTVPAELGVDHFAAFPSEWPRRLIMGWSPTGWCTACGEPRQMAWEKTGTSTYAQLKAAGDMMLGRDVGPISEPGNSGQTKNGEGKPVTYVATPRESLGYRCGCPDTDAPTRPAVVLDPFCGTGTTVAVAHHLGRHGIGIDLSSDYLRLAEWRCTSDTALRDKVLARSDLPKAPKIDGQLFLEGLGG